MMQFDLAGLEAYRYEQREQNVFYEAPEFKLRVIELAPGESLPQCAMASHVVFVSVRGEAEVVADGEAMTIGPGQCIVTEPATITMSSRTGARLLGIQIRGGRT